MKHTITQSIKNWIKGLSLKFPFLIKYANSISCTAANRDIFIRFRPEVLFKSPRHREIALSKSPNRKKYVITDCHNLPNHVLDMGQIIFSLDEIPLREFPNSLIYILLVIAMHCQS